MTEQMGTKLSRRNFVLGLAGLGLFSWTFSEAHAFQPFEPFTFAFVTDVHLCIDQQDSYKLTRESQLFLQELVKELNASKVDFVVFGGDQVEGVGRDETNWQLFLDCVQTLNAPWSFILGESDVSGNYPVDKRKTFGPDWKQRGTDTETSYWSHNLAQSPNVHLIGLDTSIPNSKTGGMSQGQLDWLKKDLEANKKYFTIVFAHHPLLPPAPYDAGPPWDEYIMPDGGTVREILGGYPNVKMVVSGHTHVSKVQSEQDLWHVSSPSLVVFPCAYRIFHVAPNMVTMETHQINFPALVKKGRKELIDSVLSSRYDRAKPDNFALLVEGAKEDRNALIPMIAGKLLQPYDPKKNAKKEDEKEKSRKDADKESKSKQEKDDKKDKKDKKKSDEKSEKNADSKKKGSEKNSDASNKESTEKSKAPEPEESNLKSKDSDATSKEQKSKDQDTNSNSSKTKSNSDAKSRAEDESGTESDSKPELESKTESKTGTSTKAKPSADSDATTKSKAKEAKSVTGADDISAPTAAPSKEKTPPPAPAKEDE